MTIKYLEVYCFINIAALALDCICLLVMLTTDTLYLMKHLRDLSTNSVDIQRTLGLQMLPNGQLTLEIFNNLSQSEVLIKVLKGN